MIVRTKNTRITVRHKTDVKLLFLPDTWDQLISEVVSKFELNNSNVVLRTDSGAVVNDIDLIR